MLQDCSPGKKVPPADTNHDTRYQYVQFHILARKFSHYFTIKVEDGDVIDPVLLFAKIKDGLLLPTIETAYRRLYQG
jgi:hypothetical protein